MPKLSTCAASPPAGVSCWICLEEGADEGGGGLVRNCACRGESGWAHLSCLAAFAKVQTNGMSAGAFAEGIEENVGTPWQACHTCKKEFNGELKENLAREWLDATSSLDDGKPQRIAARLNFAQVMEERGFPEVAIDAADKLRSDLHEFYVRSLMQEEIQGIDPDLAAAVEFVCLGTLVQAHMALGNNEKVHKYAEEMRSFNEKAHINDPDVVNDAMRLLTGRLEGRGSNSDDLRIHTDMYNCAVAREGKDSPPAIMAATSVGGVFLEMGNFEKAHQWLKETNARAKRVFGKENPAYIDIRRKFLLVHGVIGPRHGTLMLKDPKLNGKKVEILRSTKDGNKYIVDLGPDGKGSTSQKFKVTPSQLVFAVDTPVRMDFGGGEICTVFVDSYAKKTNSYKVFATSGVGDGDSFEYFTIHRNKLQVMFSQPSMFSQLSKLGL